MTDRQVSILSILRTSKEPTSAQKLGDTLSVSRQVIVGDIALLRALGHNIIATPRGYLLPDNIQNAKYKGKIVCMHKASEAIDELRTIVDLGGGVIDVSIFHEIYGELIGILNITSRIEADIFIQKCADFKSRFLAELTNGIHTHTIETKDKEAFENIKEALRKQGLLYE